MGAFKRLLIISACLKKDTRVLPFGSTVQPCARISMQLTRFDPGLGLIQHSVFWELVKYVLWIPFHVVLSPFGCYWEANCVVARVLDVLKWYRGGIMSVCSSSMHCKCTTERCFKNDSRKGQVRQIHLYRVRFKSVKISDTVTWQME